MDKSIEKIREELSLLDDIEWDVSRSGECKVLDLVGRQVYVCTKDKAVIETIAGLAPKSSKDVFKNEDDSPNGQMTFSLNYVRQCLVYNDFERAYFKELYEGLKGTTGEKDDKNI